MAENGATSYGSGTLVDVRDEFGLVVTNWHVVRDAAGPIEVVFPDGFRSLARPLKLDKDWDLAALVIWRPQAKPVNIAASAPRSGDVLTIAGYGQGAYRAATGRCTQYVAPAANFPFEMVEVNVQARQGDSGGPIFNQQGELAGVLFGAGQGTTSGSYAGRVEGFLATLAPDIGDPNKMVAQRSSANTKPMQPVDAERLRDERPANDFAQGDPPAISAAGALSGRQSEVASNMRPLWAQKSALEDHPATESTPPSAPPTAALPAPPTAEVQRLSFTWRDMAGETLFDQTKAVLAIIGALAVLVLALRIAC